LYEAFLAFIAVAMFLGKNAYFVRPSLCVGIPTQINSLNQRHCEGRLSMGLGTRMHSVIKLVSRPICLSVDFNQNTEEISRNIKFVLDVIKKV
jgi:hypothetical protein